MSIEFRLILQAQTADGTVAICIQNDERCITLNDGFCIQNDAIYANIQVTADHATVVPSAEVVASAKASVTIKYTLVSASGAVAATATTKATQVGSDKTTPTIVSGAALSVTKPELWR